MLLGWPVYCALDPRRTVTPNGSITSVRLVDLSPNWMVATVFDAEGRQVAHWQEHEGAPRRGMGITFRCPLLHEACYIGVLFANPIDGGPPAGFRKVAVLGPDRQPIYDGPNMRVALLPNNLWQRTGDTFETLTLQPSILVPGSGGPGDCNWHGFITNGEVT